MMRQKIRRTILLISFLFFPITLYYFSPALIIMGAAAGIIVGRGFCGWGCPGAGLQEACFMIQNRKNN